MDYIRKLPLLMGLTGAILTGLTGYTHQVHNNKNVSNMIIVMVIFYIIGLMVKNTVMDIMETNQRKAQEREAEEKRLALEKKKEEEALVAEAGNDSGTAINLVADEELDLEMGEEFSPLHVADYIEKELAK